MTSTALRGLHFATEPADQAGDRPLVERSAVAPTGRHFAIPEPDGDPTLLELAPIERTDDAPEAASTTAPPTGRHFAVAVDDQAGAAEAPAQTSVDAQAEPDDIPRAGRHFAVSQAPVAGEPAEPTDDALKARDDSAAAPHKGRHFVVVEEPVAVQPARQADSSRGKHFAAGADFPDEDEPVLDVATDDAPLLAFEAPLSPERGLFVSHPLRLSAAGAIAAGLVAALLYASYSRPTDSTQTAPKADEASPAASSAAPLSQPPSNGVSLSDLNRAQLAAYESVPVAEATSLLHKPTCSCDSTSLTSTAAFARLARAITALEGKGYEVGVVVCDLETGASFSYNDDHVFYPASSVKGPYVTCLYEQLVESGEASLSSVSSLARQIIVDSDNGSYSRLHDRYGCNVFARWLEKLNIESGAYESCERLSKTQYPFLTPRQLSQMWQHMYAYLSSGTSAAQQLASYFEGRSYSAVKDTLGELHTTWGKAGWYPLESGANYAATADAGIVFDEHPYLVVVMSNVPADMQAIEPVAATLEDVHLALRERALEDALFEQLTSTEFFEA